MYDEANIGHAVESDNTDLAIDFSFSLLSSY